MRQCKDETRRSVGEIDETHVATVLPSQTPGSGQTETSAAACAATTVEGIEEMLALSGWRPRAVILNHKIDATD